MKKDNTYFGITFPHDFPIDKTNQMRLAKLLLLNTKVQITSIKRIINNTVLWSKIGLLTKKLPFDLLNISMNTEPMDQVIKDEESFFERLFNWVLDYSFLTSEETSEIAKSLHIKKLEIIQEFQQMLLNDQMSAEKVIDFLTKFSTELQISSINILLDLYLGKIKISNATDHADNL